ncbi:hypothetical protein C8F01DRAFT_1140594, partial [Mycena amicta]
ILTNGCMMGRRHGPGLLVLRHRRRSSSASISIFECRFSIDSDTGPDTTIQCFSASSHRFLRRPLPHLPQYPQWPANYLILLDPFLAVHHRPTQYFPILGRKTSHIAKSFLLLAAYPTWATALTSSVVTERRGRVVVTFRCWAGLVPQQCSSMVRKTRTTTRDPYACIPSAIRSPPWPSPRPPPEKSSQEIRSTRPPCSLRRFSQYTYHLGRPSLTTPFLSMLTTTTVLGPPPAFSTTSPPSG